MRPTSVAVSGDHVYVLNNGGPNLAGVRIDDGRLVALEGSARPLSGDDADPAQGAFSVDGRTLVVTERGTDSISTYAVDERGFADGPTTIPSSGKTPYGFDFTAGGTMIVTEAFGGAMGAAAASSYSLNGSGTLAPVSGSVGDTRSEVCYAAVTNDGRFAYVTNFGDGTISSYEIAGDGTLALRSAVAGSTRLGEKGIRDGVITRDGRYRYAIDADARKVFGWTLRGDCEFVPVGAFDGVPTPSQGSRRAESRKAPAASPYTGQLGRSTRKGPMTRACCPSCRMRFTSVSAAHLEACPACGQALQSVPSARAALGYRLFEFTDPLTELPVAVEAALPVPPWPHGPRQP